MHCEVDNCINPITHITYNHICYTCGNKHGMYPCSKLVKSIKPCAVKGCDNPTSHVTFFHSCIYCKKRHGNEICYLTKQPETQIDHKIRYFGWYRGAIYLINDESITQIYNSEDLKYLPWNAIRIDAKYKIWEMEYPWVYFHMHIMEDDSLKYVRPPQKALEPKYKPIEYFSNEYTKEELNNRRTQFSQIQFPEKIIETKYYSLFPPNKLFNL